MYTAVNIFIFLYTCGRDSPRYISRSGIAFPNFSTNWVFIFLRKIFAPSVILLGLTLIRSGMTFYSDSVSFLIFHKSMSILGLLSIKAKGNYLTKVICETLVRKKELKVAFIQDLSNMQMRKQ
jgi:hypothetical protein